MPAAGAALPAQGWVTWKQSTKDRGFPFSIQEQQPVLLLPCSILILAGLRQQEQPIHTHLAATLSSVSGALLKEKVFN